MLVEGSPARHVQRLGAAAEGQDRQPAGVGAAGQLQLEAVEVGLYRSQLGVPALVVGRGVEVGSAR
jgi:hypothetical protein